MMYEGGALPVITRLLSINYGRPAITEYVLTFEGHDTFAVRLVDFVLSLS
jgi:hypothetical protein